MRRPVAALAVIVTVLAASCAPSALVPDDDHSTVLIPPTSISACTPETCSTAP